MQRRSDLLKTFIFTFPAEQYQSSLGFLNSDIDIMLDTIFGKFGMIDLKILIDEWFSFCRSLQVQLAP